MCELKNCKSKEEDVRVNEDIGDGCWSVYICKNCADKLGLKDGDHYYDDMA